MESMGEFHPLLAKKNTNAHLKFDKKPSRKKPILMAPKT